MLLVQLCHIDDAIYSFVHVLACSRDHTVSAGIYNSIEVHGAIVFALLFAAYIQDERRSKN